MHSPYGAKILGPEEPLIREISCSKKNRMSPRIIQDLSELPRRQLQATLFPLSNDAFLQSEKENYIREPALTNMSSGSKPMTPSDASRIQSAIGNEAGA